LFEVCRAEQHEPFLDFPPKRATYAASLSDCTDIEASIGAIYEFVPYSEKDLDESGRGLYTGVNDMNSVH
jgi:hypothetical protein